MLFAWPSDLPKDIHVVEQGFNTEILTKQNIFFPDRKKLFLIPPQDPLKTVILQPVSLNSPLPTWIRLYKITWNSLMSWSMIEIGQNLTPNYITVHSDPDMFPITDRKIFVKKYEKKYGATPIFAHACARTNNWEPLWLNLSINRDSTWLHKDYVDNWGNAGSWFLSIRNWKLKAKLLSEVTYKGSNPADIEWFQERLWFSQKEWNRFTSVVRKNFTNTSTRRRLIRLTDGTLLMRQTDTPREKMYDNIDNDANSVFINCNGKTAKIDWAFSQESVWSGEVHIHWVSNNQLPRERQGTPPESNVMVRSK